MIFTFILLIFAVSVVTIALPLFWDKLQLYQLPEKSNQDYSQADSWLSALSDLEVDYSLRRMSKKEYQQQKIFLQRAYLEIIEEKSGKSEEL